jgi:hypothetical protein
VNVKYISYTDFRTTHSTCNIKILTAATQENVSHIKAYTQCFLCNMSVCAYVCVYVCVCIYIYIYISVGGSYNCTIFQSLTPCINRYSLRQTAEKRCCVSTVNDMYIFKLNYFCIIERIRQPISTSHSKWT